MRRLNRQSRAAQRLAIWKLTPVASAPGCQLCFGHRGCLASAGRWIAEPSRLRRQHGPVGSDDAQGQKKSAKRISIVVSPDNRFALAADLGIDKILNYRLDAASAQLTANEAQPFIQLTPGSGPRHLTFHPNGQRVYVINELNNTVTFFDYATDSGTLTQRQTISTLPDDFSDKSATADLKITPDGKFLYGTNRGHAALQFFVSPTMACCSG